MLTEVKIISYHVSVKYNYVVVRKVKSLFIYENNLKKSNVSRSASKAGSDTVDHYAKSDSSQLWHQWTNPLYTKKT